MTETDQPSKVRLVRGKPVADVDALRKYHREYYHSNKQECECEHCHSISPARVPWSGTSDQRRSASCKEQGLSWRI